MRLGWVLLCWSAALLGACGRSHEPSLSRGLADDEFWQLSQNLSEPPGTFAHSENLVSNELDYVQTLRVLRPMGGAYVGVGPEQNFSYIAALRPEIAFIVDIRRENRALHLLYKALFEVSAGPADFLVRLFSRAMSFRSDGEPSVQQLFEALAAAPPTSEMLQATRGVVRHHLLEVRRFPVSDDDFAWMDHALGRFYAEGPEIDYGPLGDDGARAPTYRRLMTATDMFRMARSYLADDDRFAFVKALQGNNLVVPVVGDFAGPVALRGIGEYLRARGGVVSAFYGSNVEVYLTKDDFRAFCETLGTLPVGARSRFIGSRRHRSFAKRLETCVTTPSLPMPKLD
jgi:hypothetical protein